MARNFKPREPFTARFDGFFEIDANVEFEPESSKSVKRNKDEQAILDFAQLAEQARGYLTDDIMRVGEFREKVLQGCMGLGINKSEKLTAYMREKDFVISSGKHRGGYWISANESLIEQKNKEIDNEKNK